MTSRNTSRFISPTSSRTRRLATAGTVGTDGIEYNGHKFPYVWLRDSCQCPRCVHPSTRQKLHRTSDIERNIRPSESNAVTLTQNGVQIHWSQDHSSFYSREFLDRYATPAKTKSFHKDVDAFPWNRSQLIASRDLFLSYESIRHPSGLLNAILQLQKYGLLFVTGIPSRETENETCETRSVAELFSEIRETFYGKLWDVINVKNSTNIAYTNLHLGLHMDLL